MDWSDDASRIEFVGVTAGQRGTLDPSLTAAAFRRAVPVVMRELPAEVQAQVRLLVDNAAQGVLRTRVLGFTIRRGLLEDSTQAEMQLYVFWDPERIQ